MRHLVAMLSGRPRPESGDRRVVRVSFQQSPVAPVDDLHVLGQRDGEEGPSLELWIAARCRALFVRSDKSTRELVAALVEAAGMPQPEGRERSLVVCVAGHQNAAAQVAELADLPGTAPRSCSTATWAEHANSCRAVASI